MTMEPYPKDDRPFLYTAVEIPPQNKIDHEWCADFTMRYGGHGFRLSKRTKQVVARDWPPEHTPPNTATSYSLFSLSKAKDEGDLVDGEVVGARIFPFYPENEDTGRPVINSPDLVLHIVLANACNITQCDELSRTEGDLISVPLGNDDHELILYK